MKPLFRWSGLRAGSPDCRWLHSRMGYYLEGALRPGAMRRANGHLDECPSCQRSATLLEESLAAARGLQPLTPAPDFEDCVWEKIRISREIERQPGLPLTSWRTRAVSAPRLVWVGGGVASLAVFAAFRA